MVENEKILCWVPAPKLTAYSDARWRETALRQSGCSLYEMETISYSCSTFYNNHRGITPVCCTRSQNTHPAGLHVAGFLHHWSPSSLPQRLSPYQDSSLPSSPHTPSCLQSHLQDSATCGRWKGEDYLLTVEKKRKL